MRTITLKTTVGGKFDMTALHQALEEHGPFEPSTEYVIDIDAKPAPGSRAEAIKAEAEPVAEAPTPKGRRRSEATSSEE